MVSSWEWIQSPGEASLYSTPPSREQELLFSQCPLLATSAARLSWSRACKRCRPTHELKVKKRQTDLEEGFPHTRVQGSEISALPIFVPQHIHGTFLSICFGFFLFYQSVHHSALPACLHIVLTTHLSNLILVPPIVLPSGLCSSHLLLQVPRRQAGITQSFKI